MPSSEIRNCASKYVSIGLKTMDYVANSQNTHICVYGRSLCVALTCYWDVAEKNTISPTGSLMKEWL